MNSHNSFNPLNSALKNRLFWIIIISLPVLLFGTAELALRLIDYAPQAPLVVRKTIGGREYFTLNRDAARRYFSQQGISIPELHDDVFEVEKRPTTKRIFMLGESTMAGFPYDYNVPAPDLLKDRLIQLLPQYTIEVINVGASAISSYTVREFVNELVDYKPDAFVVYLGHNEFYGALGVGSTEYLGQSGTIVNLYLSLSNIRLFRLARNMVNSVQHWFKPDVTPRQATLMEAMVKQKIISYHSTEYLAARSNFESNLIAIIRTAKKRGIPLVLSTLTSNIRDQRPLLSTPSPAVNDEQRMRWNELLKAGFREVEAGWPDSASARFRDAIAIDSLNAEAHFRLAQCLEQSGHYDKAYEEYKKARDYDGLRFRASTDFNSLIRDLCRREEVPLADAELAFEQASPHRLVGNNLMLEHLHPNFDGYFLLAKTFFSALKSSTAFMPDREYHGENDLTDNAYKELATVTAFDLEAGRYRIRELTKSWPFKHDSTSLDEPPPQNFVQEQAIRYIHKQIAWSQAHYDIADWYKRRGEYDSALAEYRAVSKVIPYSYYPFMQIGDVYRLMNRPEDAQKTYRHALSVQPSPFVHVRLGMLYFEGNRNGEAIGEFEATVAAEKEGAENLDTKARSMARFFLGAAYGKSGNLQRAKVNLRTALQLDPQNADAKKMLEQIP